MLYAIKISKQKNAAAAIIRFKILNLYYGLKFEQATLKEFKHFHKGSNIDKCLDACILAL